MSIAIGLNFIAPELAHCLMSLGLRSGIVRCKNNVHDQRLSQNLLGCKFVHPVGLAAGFDKNAECISPLLGKVFSFMEVGSTTIGAQLGNARPRVFRLPRDSAVINRLGFNNKGVENLIKNVKRAQSRNSAQGVLGINIGMSKNSQDPYKDYLSLLQKVSGMCDYITVNISSPNTEGLRDLQYGEKIEKLLKGLEQKRSEVLNVLGKKHLPILIKISPDIPQDIIPYIADSAIKYGVDGLVLTNTSTGCREGLLSNSANQKGGLSGKPLFVLSNRVLQSFYKASEGKLLLVGCGGIMSADDAYTKIKLGASLVQIYTGLIYKGFKLVERINRSLLDKIQKDGFQNISEAVGTGVKEFL